MKHLKTAQVVWPDLAPLEHGDSELLSSSLSEEISKILAEEIDWEIVSNMLVAHSGWIKVVISTSDEKKASEWLKEHKYESEYMQHNNVFLFKTTDELVSNFILRWK